jgi:uncharacterized cupredoxin-like copper-binding protein
MSTSRLALAVTTSAVALVITVAGCGSSSSSSSTSSGGGGGGGGGSASSGGGGASGGGQTLKLTANPSGALSFNTSSLSAKAGKVTLQMSNPSSSGTPHGIAVEGNGVDKDGQIVDPGQGSLLTVDLKPGTYEFYCPFDGHKQAGMKGTLKVQ